MKNGWRECRLGDLFQIKHGYAFKGAYFGTEGSHIVLTPGNFFDEGGFKRTAGKEKWYSGEVPPDYILSQGDLIVAMTEQAEGLLGSSAIIPEDNVYLHNQRLGLIEGANGTDTNFLYYLFNSQPVRHQIRASSSGVKVRHTSPSRIYEVKATIPDLPTQRKIAGILSAYDDLIDNNLRRIRILEDMAQSLYREWFVHFRFPGHQSTKLTNSPLGQIPKGWKVKKMGEVAKIVMGLSPKGHTYNDTGEGMALVNGPVEFSERFTKRIKWTTAPTKSCKAGDLVVCVRGSTTGKHVKSDGEYCLGRGVCSMSSEFQAFVDQMFAEQLPTLLAMTSGSTFPSWTGPLLQSHPVIAPPRRTLESFERLAAPMSDSIQTLARKNQTLRQTRDLLLPKLLAG